MNDKPAPSGAPSDSPPVDQVPIADAIAQSEETASTPDSAVAPSATGQSEGTGLSEDAVREEMKKVIDPELFVNIVDLGLVYKIDVGDPAEGGRKVEIEMTMTSPACPAGPQLIGQTKQFVGQMPEVGEVEVRIVMDPPWTPDLMTEDARDQLGIF